MSPFLHSSCVVTVIDEAFAVECADVSLCSSVTRQAVLRYLVIVTNCNSNISILQTQWLGELEEIMKFSISGDTDIIGRQFHYLLITSYILQR